MKTETMQRGMNKRAAFKLGKKLRLNNVGKDEVPYSKEHAELRKKCLEGWEITDSKIEFGMVEPK